MTAGKGWIALAIVVFAMWRPLRVRAGAELFGGITILQLHAQELGVRVDAQVLAMLPCRATIVVLMPVSFQNGAMRIGAPGSLGKPFQAVG